MSRKYLQQLIKSLREFYKCPSCGTNYYLDDIKFLGEVENHCFVQLSCHDCSLPMLATITEGGKGEVRIKSDLGKVEEDSFVDKGEITSDEIADFHAFISSYHGSLNKLV